MNIEELAGIAVKSFETRTRADGDKFICRKDDAPEWVEDLCREAHGDAFPDDFIYRIIWDAVCAIADNDGDEDAARDSVSEPDIYNSDLLAWVSGDLHRAQYADDAIKEFGADTLFAALQYGQSEQRGEIFDAVWSFLEEKADDDDESDDDKD